MAKVVFCACERSLSKVLVISASCISIPGADALEQRSDEELMEAAAADSLPAFEDLAGRYTHRLLRFTERLTGDASAAESITEEALCSLFSRRKNLPPASRVSVLLYWTASKLSHQ